MNIEKIEESFFKDSILKLCYDDLVKLDGSEGTGIKKKLKKGYIGKIVYVDFIC